MKTIFSYYYGAALQRKNEIADNLRLCQERFLEILDDRFHRITGWREVRMYILLYCLMLYVQL